MLPHSNSHLRQPGNQPQHTGIPASAPVQVIGVPGNILPNPMQIHPQFPMGVFNNQPLPLLPFTNQAPYLASTQLFPFVQGSFQNLNANNFPQFFPNNVFNHLQLFPNGQLNVPNLVQNVHHVLPMQLANCDPEKSGILTNAQLGLVNENTALQQPVKGSALTDAAMRKDSGSFQPQSFNSHGVSKQQSSAGTINRKNWRNFHNNNYSGNPKRDASEGRFTKCQPDCRQNARLNFNCNNDNEEKGQQIVRAKKVNSSHSSKPNQVAKKRSLMLSYTKQEILQWREERRKNFPTKSNMEKKLKENQATVANTRRQQLKEILAKQAELGCEVADVPSCYLSDSGQQADNRSVNKSLLAKSEKFRRFDRKGQFQQNARFRKRRGPPHHDSVNLQGQSGRFNKKQRSGSAINLHTDNNIKEPSLLIKLLNSDIRRDKKRLLQVFRFILKNSFFNNWPDKALQFPEVIVKEAADDGEIAEESAGLLETGACDESNTGIDGTHISEGCSFYDVVETSEEKFTDGSDDLDGCVNDENASCGGDDVSRYNKCKKP